MAYLSHENRTQTIFGLLVERLGPRFIVFFCIASNIKQNNRAIRYLFFIIARKEAKMLKIINKI